MEGVRLALVVLFSFLGGAAAVAAMVSYAAMIHDWRPAAFGFAASAALVAGLVFLPWA